MVHFDFVISDEEGEILFDLINDQIANYKEKLIYQPSKEGEWYKHINGFIAVLQALRVKMTNYRAEED